MFKLILFTEKNHIKVLDVLKLLLMKDYFIL